MVSDRNWNVLCNSTKKKKKERKIMFLNDSNKRNEDELILDILRKHILNFSKQFLNEDGSL